jgi:hypothetical protein
MDDAGSKISAGAAIPPPAAPVPQASRLRLLTRALIVVGILLLVLGAQGDRAVRTAYDTGWTRSEVSDARVPAGAWEVVLPGSGPAAIVLLLVAVVLWHRREKKETLAASDSDVVYTPWALGIAAVALSLGAATCRFLAIDDGGSGLLTVAQLCNLAALAAVTSYALVVGNLIYFAYGGIFRVTRGVFRRQRVNIAIVALLTAAMLFIGDTSGQSVDSIRSWSPWVFGSEDPRHAAGAARLMLGLAAALMFALALYESGSLLVRSRWATSPPGRIPLGVVAGVATLLGLLVLTPLPIGPGLVIAGVILALLLVLDLPNVQADAGGGLASAAGWPPGQAGSVGRMRSVLVLARAQAHAPTRAEAHMAEWIAITPLVALAAVSVTAGVESALVHGWSDGNTLITLVPAVALVVFAVLMTAIRPNAPHDLRWVPGHWIVVTLGVLALTVVVFLLAYAADERAEWVLAVYGFAWLVALLWYAGWLFQSGPPALGALLVAVPEHAHTPRTGSYLSRVRTYVAKSAVSFVLGPVALGGGIAVFLAVHLEPVDAGQKLGVFTLAFVALALALPFLHVAVRATLRLRPPKLLWWFGLNQVPVLTLLLLWWIAVGVAQTHMDKSATLHDARLVDRGVGAGPHAAPDLARAFRDWVRAQDDIVDTGGNEPIPLVLVAAHGGGIRAAYWTAVALDCVVGYSAAGVTQAQLDDRDPSATRALRDRACFLTRRPDAEQAAAAKRIFLASGVSGGAVGLYAYARQLIADGMLGTKKTGQRGWWIDAHLADDFAAPAIGWALFHDIPNRLLGLHPKTGGRCGDAIVNDVCLEQDRAAVLEQTFDATWRVPELDTAQIRRVFDLRSVREGEQRDRARLVPLLAMNSTLTGGRARAINSAADLGAWPEPDAGSPRTGDDSLPLAGTIEIRDALCVSQDMRLSTAALLAARFPYVTPSGRVPGKCGAEDDPERPDEGAPCAHPKRVDCGGNYVDGGYTDNSGLATIVGIWPSLRQLVVQHNLYAKSLGLRTIAPLIVELDNHYQKSLQPTVPAGGTTAETLVPPSTAFGGRHAIETAARAAAYRILPVSCTITISPALHPGLIAPLGWELSEAARRDLQDGLTTPHPADKQGTAVRNLITLQLRLSAERDPGRVVGRPLTACLPVEPCQASAALSQGLSALELAKVGRCRSRERAAAVRAKAIKKAAAGG